MNLFDIFRTGAMALASETMEYVSVHANYGIGIDNWELLTTTEIWTVQERIPIRSILTEIINISMTISGIPAQPLPAQYVAAIIAIIIAPCNRLVACSCAPEAFDGELSSGLLGKSEIRNVPVTTLISLVLAYSSKIHLEPSASKISTQIAAQSVAMINDTSDKKSVSKK